MIQDAAITCYDFTHKHPSNPVLHTKRDGPLTSAACPASTGFSPTVATGLGDALSEAQSGFLGSKAAVCQPTSQDKFSVKFLVCTVSQYGCTSKTNGAPHFFWFFDSSSTVFSKIFLGTRTCSTPPRAYQGHQWGRPAFHGWIVSVLAPPWKKLQQSHHLFGFEV